MHSTQKSPAKVSKCKIELPDLGLLQLVRAHYIDMRQGRTIQGAINLEDFEAH